MKSIHWAILVGIGVLVVGVIFGVAGLFLAPILGLIAMIALIIWLIERKARHKPPIE